MELYCVSLQSTGQHGGEAFRLISILMFPPAVPAALDGCQSLSAALNSPPSGESNLPWKGGVGSPPPCVSVEATKIIPVDLQQAWNQSISSLESISSPTTLAEPVHPRVSALSRSGANRPASYTSSGTSSPTGAPVAQVSLRLPEKRREEEEEDYEGAALPEMQPLMLSPKPLGVLSSPLAAGSTHSSGAKRNPCVYLRSLVTTPPSGSGEPHSRGPTQL